MTFHIRTDINERTNPRELLSYIATLEQRVMVEQDVDELQAVANLRRLFSLTPCEARVLVAMSDGRTWPKGALIDSLYSASADDPPTLKIIDVWVCKIRRKLDGCVRVVTEWGIGYRVVDTEPLKHAMRGEMPAETDEYVAEQTSRKGRFTRRQARVIEWLRGIADADGRSTFSARAFADATGVAQPAMQISHMAATGKLRIIERAKQGGRGRWVVEVVS